MKFQNDKSDVTNLKTYFELGKGNSFFIQYPKLAASGYLIDDPNWTSNVHMHSFAELILCTGGTGKTTIMKKDYQITPGDLIIHNPNTPHSESSSPSNPLNFLFIGLADFQICNHPKNIILDPQAKPVVQTGDARNQLEFLFTEIVRESLDGKAYYQEIAEALSNSILAIAFRLLAQNTEHVENISPHSMRIKEYIDNNYDADFKLSDLSSAVYISQTYISHIFKSDMGISPIQYLANKRIAHAKELLRTTDLTVSEISAKCGYDDPVYFSQVFKKVTGSSPSQFKSQKN